MRLLREVSVDTEEHEDLENLKIMSVTWNLQGGCPKYNELEKLFQKNKVYHDIYAMST
jgi:hypothetical protein